ncbi:DNA-(apurinic or apyrimidinic site) lyase [Plakobranchus ocellatus]|uniref:DNA-(apurinic or apyrimidinic site) endonuclease n=1 Tax=Plakobranchus ocellatus TaxID=259542 RepID=A0AAV4DD92_9GAST|nr:DNA-(apurinic or apyrimidinic site) lyase [Plakobranchus ocellatus]
MNNFDDDNKYNNNNNNNINNNNNNKNNSDNDDDDNGDYDNYCNILKDISIILCRLRTWGSLLQGLPEKLQGTWFLRASVKIRQNLQASSVESVQRHFALPALFSNTVKKSHLGSSFQKNPLSILKPFSGLLYKAIPMGPKRAAKATKATEKTEPENAEKAKSRKGAKATKATEKAKPETVEQAKPKKAAKATKATEKAKPETAEKAQDAKPKKSPQKRKAESAAEDEPKPKLKARVSISDTIKDTDFSATGKTQDGRASNFKIASWNINGIRAWLDKDGTSYIKAEQPDVLCVQELKCDTSKIPAQTAVDGYTTHWLSGDTEGYSGVGIYYKTKPIKITDGIGISKHDDEGRVITAEFEKFFLVNTYIPNSGRNLVRLKYRTQEWDVAFRNYLKSLDEKKPVIWCGDLNVAHQEIDIKNPKTNKRNAGFTQEERDSFTETLEEGFIDSFRELYPEEEGAYTFWTYMMNARAKNVGWRLDYFVVSKRFKENICDNIIRSKVMGSDHCPIVLQLAL